MLELNHTEIDSVSGGVVFLAPAVIGIAKWVGYVGGTLGLAAIGINQIR